MTAILRDILETHVKAGHNYWTFTSTVLQKIFTKKKKKSITLVKGTTGLRGGGDGVCGGANQAGWQWLPRSRYRYVGGT